jgi:ubiquinone/menaquinone biosynthesis C-methylase UbiE
VRSWISEATREAYEHWAPLYPPLAHNPLMRAEQRSMLAHWPEVTGRRALDLGSGSGRYSRLLAETHAAQIIAVDFCAPMLARLGAATRVCGCMMRLPFADNTFDVVVCGLALGHATDLEAWMAETSRVLRPGGTLLYSDFHPEAAQMGLTRSFNDASGRTWTAPHHYHEVARQRRSAAAAGLAIEVLDEISVGVQLREPFANSEDFYRQWHGLPIVLVVRARKQ